MRRAVCGVAACALAFLGGGSARADLYDDAVAHAGRPAADLQRDATDHPAQVLRLAGIQPGMVIADFLAADGYYSELLRYVVGPHGHVYLLNDAAWDKWIDNQWQERLLRLPNLEHRTIDMHHLGLPPHSLDGIVLLIDHSAKPGTGREAAGTLHRIDEEFARRDFEKHGFVLVARSGVLRRPDDPRDMITFRGEMVGKTDRFVMVFHRSAAKTVRARRRR